jgi:hypothetical protein
MQSNGTSYTKEGVGSTGVFATASEAESWVPSCGIIGKHRRVKPFMICFGRFNVRVVVGTRDYMAPLVVVVGAVLSQRRHCTAV